MIGHLRAYLSLNYTPLNLITTTNKLRHCGMVLTQKVNFVRKKLYHGKREYSE